MTYEGALAKLYEALPAFHRIGAAALKPGLENTLQLLSRFGNPHLAFKSIHIAGTNGKGSSSHMLASVLQEAGYKTGLYTSPHLKDYRERIRINGHMIPKQRVVHFVEHELSTVADGISPSFFEATVALCFQYFKEEGIEIGVIETGLGGRLDSTNVVHPLLSLITNIGYDHQDLLGPTLPLIAAEKAGIIKPHTPVVVSERQTETDEVFTEKARLEAVSITFASDVWSFDRSDNTASYTRLSGESIKFRPDLSGSYQTKNTAGVLEVLHQLRGLGWHLPEAAVVAGLEHVRANTGLAGRWHVLQQSPLVVADTAHNVNGLEQVFKQAQEKAALGRLYIILGMVADKDLEKVFSLLPHYASYIFAEPSVFRARKAAELAQLIEENTGIQGAVCPDVNLAIEQLLPQLQPDDVVLITGSTFLVADLNQLV